MANARLRAAHRSTHPSAALTDDHPSRGDHRDAEPSTIEAPACAEPLAEDFLNRPPSVGQRVHSVLHRQPALSPAIVLVLAVRGIQPASSRFYQLQNLSLVAQQVAVVGTLAAGQTLIILTAGIDLSIGAVMVLSSLVMAKLVSSSTCRRCWRC